MRLRKLTIILLMILLPAICYAGSARRFFATTGCSLPVTEGIGDTGNYLSAWSLTGGACGTLYFTADWSVYEQDWLINIYADINHAYKLGYGLGKGAIAISGTVHGTVTAIDGSGSDIYEEGTLTR